MPKPIKTTSAVKIPKSGKGLDGVGKPKTPKAPEQLGKPRMPRMTAIQQPPKTGMMALKPIAPTKIK